MELLKISLQKKTFTQYNYHSCSSLSVNSVCLSKSLSTSGFSLELFLPIFFFLFQCALLKLRLGEKKVLQGPFFFTLFQVIMKRFFVCLTQCMLLVLAQSKVRLMVSIDFTLSSNSVFELHKKFVFSPAKDVTFFCCYYSRCL